MHSSAEGAPGAAVAGAALPALRSPVASALPTELYLEVTNRCNLRCRTCPQYFGMAEPFTDLTLEQFFAITEQFPQLTRVVLHGIGEPLLHPHLPTMIRHLKQRGAYVLFNSNGLLLRGRRLAGVVESGLDELRVSIDSASPATYQRVRGTDGYQQIFANLRRLREEKEARGLTTPAVSLWMTGLRSTINELPALVRAAHSAGVRTVYLQRLVYSERGLARADESLFGCGGDEAGAVRSAVALAETLGVTLRGSGEVEPLQQIQEHGGPEAAWRSCQRPWTLTYVTANGHVLPCCIAPFTDAQYASLVLGNLTTQTVAQVWNGERYQRWRAALLSDTPPAACAGCGACWSL